MRVVEAIIREVVESYAIVTLDEHGMITDVENVEEKDRYDIEIVDTIKEIEKDEPIKDPREVE